MPKTKLIMKDLKPVFKAVIREIKRNSSNAPKKMDFFARIPIEDHDKFIKYSEKMGISRSRVAQTLLHEFLKFVESNQ